MNGHPSAPIGVFDSGLGGLSVLRELRAALPAEDALYYADRAHCPYGLLPPDAILARADAIAAELRDLGAKLLVVACNTASSVALAELRARHLLPIVGLVPAVKPAVALSRTGKVAVLATPRTVAGPSLAALVREHGRGAEVHLVPAPGLVALVEAGETAGPRVEAALRPLLGPPLARGVDTLVLGCTHYPFLREAIRAVAGPDVAVVDSGAAIARRARAVLAERRALRDGGHGRVTFLTSGDAPSGAALAARLLGESVAAAAPLPA